MCPECKESRYFQQQRLHENHLSTSSECLPPANVECSTTRTVTTRTVTTRTVTRTGQDRTVQQRVTASHAAEVDCKRCCIEEDEQSRDWTLTVLENTKYSMWPIQIACLIKPYISVLKKLNGLKIASRLNVSVVMNVLDYPGQNKVFHCQDSPHGLPPYNCV